MKQRTLEKRLPRLALILWPGFGVAERVWRGCAARIGVWLWDVRIGRADSMT
jgi:hypothetical protein